MNQQQQGDELATLLKEDIRTSKEVLDEELHRHIKSRTGNIFRTYGSALYSAASMANSRIFKIVLSAIGVLLGSSILFCAVKSMSVYVKQRGMVRIRKCNMYEDDNDELDESTGQALIDLWYSTTFGEHELFNANKRRLSHTMHKRSNSRRCSKRKCSLDRFRIPPPRPTPINHKKETVVEYSDELEHRPVTRTVQHKGVQKTQRQGSPF